MGLVADLLWSDPDEVCNSLVDGPSSKRQELIYICQNSADLYAYKYICTKKMPFDISMEKVELKKMTVKFWRRTQKDS